MAIKTCSKCKKETDVEHFFKHKQTKDGFHSWCKSCCKEANLKSKDKINSNIESRAVVFLRNAKNSAYKRNNEFDLNVDDIVEFWNKQNKICAYSGVEMTLESGKLNTVSIERIDSKIGYTKENTILVCQAVNRMKSDFSLNEFFDLCKLVTTFLSDEDLNLSVGAYK